MKIKTYVLRVCVCLMARGEYKVMLVECLDNQVVWLLCWC